MLDKQFNSAISELTVFIKKRCLQLSIDGWSYFETDKAPESFKELLTYKDSKSLPIANYGNEFTIYPNESANTSFRFWHDCLHIEYNKGFSFNDELFISNIHIQDARKEGLSLDAIRILIADTRGQIQYYYKHKEFVTYQKAFVQEYLKRGESSIYYKFH